MQPEPNYFRGEEFDQRGVVGFKMLIVNLVMSAQANVEIEQRAQSENKRLS